MLERQLAALLCIASCEEEGKREDGIEHCVPEQAAKRVSRETCDGGVKSAIAKLESMIRKGTSRDGILIMYSPSRASDHSLRIGMTEVGILLSQEFEYGVEGDSRLKKQCSSALTLGPSCHVMNSLRLANELGVENGVPALAGVSPAPLAGAIDPATEAWVASGEIPSNGHCT